MNQNRLQTTLGKLSPLLQIEYHNNADGYHTFMQYHYIKRSWFAIVTTVLVMLVASLLFGLVARNFAATIVLAAIGVIFPIIMPVGAYLQAVHHMQRNRNYLNRKNDYRFYENMVYLKSQCNGKFHDQVLRYETLSAVCKNGSFLYLYFDKMNAFIIDQHNLSNEKKDLLYRLLK